MLREAERFQLNPDLQISAEESKSYVLRNIGSDQYWKVSEELVRFLNHFEKGSSLERVLRSYNKERPSCSDESSLRQLHQFAWKRAAWLIPSDSKPIREAKKTKPPTYLQWSFILINSAWVNRLSKKLTFFFSRPVLMGFLALFIAVWIQETMLVPAEIIIQPSTGFEFVALMFVSVLFHEFGHSSALVYSGEKAGAIGGAFYLLSPVLYANVTNIWALKRGRRQLVNFAGMYFEMIFCSLGVIISILMNWDSGRSLFLLIGTKTLWNLNPFIKSDGYWILVDGMGVSNLSQKSIAVWKGLLRGSLKPSSFFLLAYGFCFGAVVIWALNSVFRNSIPLLLELYSSMVTESNNAMGIFSFKVSWSKIFGLLPMFVLLSLGIKSLDLLNKNLSKRMSSAG